MNFLIKFFIIILLMFGAVFYYAPYYVLSRMQANAMNGYNEGLLRYINQPEFKANTTNLLTKGWTEAPSIANSSSRQFKELAAKQMTEAMIDPKNMAMILINGRFPYIEETVKPESSSKAFANGHYESINVFLVTIKKKKMGAKPFDLVLTRKGLFSWELTNIRVNAESIWPL